MSSPCIAKLVLEIEGRRFVYAAPVPEGIDPMEMTLDDWRRYQQLSADALLDEFVNPPPAPPAEAI